MASATPKYTAVKQYDPSQDEEFQLYVQNKDRASAQKQLKKEARYAALLATVIVLTALFGLLEVDPELKANVAAKDGHGSNPQRKSMNAASWAINLIGYPVGIAALISICVLRSMDPGRVKRSGDYGADATRCKVCGLLRPATRAHHCRVCGHCVEEFDHHCFVLGVCIAKKNRVLFCALLFFGAIAFSVATFALWQLLVFEIHHSPVFRSTVKALNAKLVPHAQQQEQLGKTIPSLGNALWTSTALYSAPLAMVTRGLPVLFYMSAAATLWIVALIQVQTLRQGQSSMTVCDMGTHMSGRPVGEKKCDDAPPRDRRPKFVAVVSDAACGCWRRFDAFVMWWAAFKRRGPYHKCLFMAVRFILSGSWCFFLLWVMWSFARPSRLQQAVVAGGDGTHEFDAFLARP